MAETPRDTGHKRHAHEQRDVNVRWVAYFGVSLVVLHIVSAALMLWLFGIFDVERRPSAMPAPLVETRPLPPGPHLQASPAQDMQEMRAAEQRLLHTYAWVDPSAGIVRIPIAQAMELVAQQGLPEWRETQGLQGENRGATDGERGTERQGQGTPRGDGGS